MTVERMPHWLTKQANLQPDKTMFELPNGKTYSFLQVKKESMRIAQQLASLNVGQHSKVAILSKNKLEIVFIIFALSYVNAVAVMLNTRLTTKELQYQLEQSNAKIVITTEQLKREKKLPIDHVVTLRDIQSLKKKDVPLATEITLSDPFTMMFTSGTTGLPKAVVHTYRNHWWSAVGSMLNLGLHDDDKWLLTLPIFHIGGFSILMRSVIYGMTIFFMETYERTAVYEALHHRQVTIASLVTLMLEHYMDDLGDGSFPSTCRTILLGGGPVSPATLHDVKYKQIPLFLSYGMTETSSQIVTLNKKYIHEKIGSSGKPLFPAEIKIAAKDEHGIGEIYVKGPMVIAGYYEAVQANRESFANGWLKTGDLGYVDEDGFLFVVDRRTDLIISGGENVYPSEIEAVIRKMKHVKEVAVVGKSDETWGEVPVAFVVLQTETVTAEQVMHHTETYLAPYKRPKEIHFVAALPRNATNKLMRYQLQKQLKEMEK